MQSYQNHRLRGGARLWWGAVGIAVLAGACGDDAKSKSNDQDGSRDTTDTSEITTGTDQGLYTAQDSTPLETEPASTEPVVVIHETLPDGFTAAAAGNSGQGLGGYRVVGPLTADAQLDTDAPCGNILRVVVRDFSESHADFENTGHFNTVEPVLGADKKPVVSPQSDAQAFDEWYRNVDGVNQAFAVDLWLQPQGDTFVFDSGCFFPLDGLGFDEAFTACCDDQQHNFHFTTELHSSFQYKGGEVFTFIGDDDVFVFIDGHLVVDIGGIHVAQEGTVRLDDVAPELGLEIGQVYSFDLFQAERQTCASNFRIETTLDFTDCGHILESDIYL